MPMSLDHFGRSARTIRSSERESFSAVPRWKRGFDLCLVVVTLVVTLPLLCMLALAVLILDGRPVFFAAPRVGERGKPFFTWKFRTMRGVSQGQRNGVCGSDQARNITNLGRFLRRARLDELPQIWNILRGEMSWVGPRPPDTKYVAMFPALYAQVLLNRPGLTGLATLHMHKFEDRVVQACATQNEADALYCRRCVPRKARLDLIYQRRLHAPGALFFDVWILMRSFAVVVLRRDIRWPHGLRLGYSSNFRGLD